MGLLALPAERRLISPAASRITNNRLASFSKLRKLASNILEKEATMGSSVDRGREGRKGNKGSGERSRHRRHLRLPWIVRFPPRREFLPPLLPRLDSHDPICRDGSTL